jgi:hypothetical protein
MVTGVPYYEPVAVQVPAKASEDEMFWKNVEKQIAEAQKGDVITIDAGSISSIPAHIIEALLSRVVILIIHLADGTQIVIDENFVGTAVEGKINLEDLL